MIKKHEHKDLARKLRLRRAELNLLSKNIAKEAGIDQTTLSRIMQGQHEPYQSTLANICKVLRLDPVTLEPIFFTRISKKLFLKFINYSNALDTKEININDTWHHVTTGIDSSIVIHYAHNIYNEHKDNPDSEYVIVDDILFHKKELMGVD